MAKGYIPEELFGKSEKEIEKDLKEEWRECLFGGKDILHWLMAKKQDRYAKDIRRLTWVIVFLTLVITIATFLQLSVAFGWIAC